MSTHRILSRGVATLLILTPFALHAATQTITAFGDPFDGTEGVNPSWGLPANWSGPNGATLPGVNDVAEILSDDLFQTAVDIRGSDFAGATPNFTEVQGLSFIGSTFSEVDLQNNSPDASMMLALNGGGGTVPLIQTGAYAVQILGVGLGQFVPTTQTLTLQLKGNGDFSVGDGGLNISAVISSSGAFGFNKTGTGTLTLSGTGANTYTGTTTISEGLVVANKSAGVNAISGNLIINSGAAFMFQGNNVGNQIANTSVITLNGGDFGDQNSVPTNPGAPETVASVIVNSGNFSTGRALFVTSGLFSAAGGTTLVHRGGSLTVGSFSLSNGGIVNLDGGSTTAGAESKITVGAGGMTLNGGTINFNSGGSGLGATSVGSIVVLGGNVTATGTNDFVRLNPTTAGPKANVSLGTAPRTFNVTGNLNFGTPAFGEAVTVSGGSAAGSIIKTGPGTLSLTGTNVLNGPVMINAGTLALNGALATASPVIIASGAKFAGVGSAPVLVTANSGSTIQPGDANGVGTLTVSSLKLGVNANDTETLNLTSTSTINVSASGGLTVNGGAQSVTINLLGAAPSVGLYTLIDYTGVFGAGIGAFKLGSLPSPRLTANLQINTTNTTINLNVTGLDFPVWKGALSNEWSTATLAAPKNWVLNTNNATTTDFLVGDTVVFNDLAVSATPTVDVSVADVTPSTVTFANVTKDYTLTGSKGIASGNLVKSGAGKLTITNTNSFTGTVALNGGTVSVATLQDAGISGPLGAGGAISFNGGTLDYTGGATSFNRAITLSAGGGKLQTNVPLILSGNISGSGTLTKLSSSTLTLTGTNTYGGTTITSGILQVGDGGPSGSLGSGPVINNGVIIFNRFDTGLVVTGAISGSGTVNQVGSGSTTLGGTTANTYTGLTTVSGGTLLGGKTPGVNAIPGDLVINGGGAFGYAGNNVSNQIADSATVTINDGTFGDPLSTGPTNPGATDTVANVNVNSSGTFNSGRNDTLSPFTITGVLNINGGTVLAQRGGSISAGTVNFSSGSLSLDGGSATAGQESEFVVGAGGMTLTNNSINLNAGPSPVAAGSVGSIVVLNGDLTSTGVSSFTRLDGGVANATVNLGGGVRTFNVTGSLDIGAPDTPITVTNGGINKTGSGTLTLNGKLELSALTIGGTGLVTLGAQTGGPGNIIAVDTSALTFIGNTKLNMTNNSMVVRGGDYATLYAKTVSGFNGGVWDGVGINSSTAAAEPDGRTAIAIVNNADLGFSDFAGITGLTGNEILFKYTYYGDADLDGNTGAEDFSAFLQGFTGAAPASWLTGDFNYDGAVGAEDFSAFLINFSTVLPQLRDPALMEQMDTFAQQLASGSGAGGNIGGDMGELSGQSGSVTANQAVVPEPGSIGLLAVGALGLLARRRRR
jgi:autotransporter-associated beta strand protein